MLGSPLLTIKMASVCSPEVLRLKYLVAGESNVGFDYLSAMRAKKD